MYLVLFSEDFTFGFSIYLGRPFWFIGLWGLSSSYEVKTLLLIKDKETSSKVLWNDGIFYAVSVYDIVWTELFTISLANERIFMVNICAWLHFSWPFPGAIGGLQARNCAFALIISRLGVTWEV